MVTRKKKICKECGDIAYIFGHGLCTPCYNKNLQKNNNGINKRGKKIPKLSKKQKSREDKYKSLREIYLKEKRICECCGIAVSTEIHHKAGRDGENLFQHFLAVCRECHDKIEMNPEWAKENNYSISRLKENENESKL